MTISIRSYRYPGTLQTVGLMPFFLGGLTDSVSPCSLTILILFFGLLFLVAKQPKVMLLAGLAYCFMALGVFYFISLGKIETIRDSIPFYWTARIYFILVGIVFMLAGWKNFRDWTKIRRQLDFPLNRPNSNEPITPMNVWEKDQRLPTTPIILGFLVLGFLNSFLASICPGQIYIALSVYTLAMQNEMKTAQYFLGLYSFAFVLPMILSLALLYFVLKSKKVMAHLKPYHSTFKILCAAVLFSVGLGLVYTFL